ncbi:MAG: hypothetical protein IT376_12670 [Polyangiaceae bacterium]|nr:hypothetical protein [Polyangiaceae bacterium]
MESTSCPRASWVELDLERAEGEAEWLRRVARVADERRALARARLARLGLIDDAGRPISDALPADLIDAGEHGAGR